MIKRLLCLFFIFTFINVKAQQIPVTYSLKTVVSSLNSFREKLPVEKLYLQVDKPYYNSGDTLRFKAYLLNADFLTPSTHSGLLYVELDDVSNKMVKRMMVPVVSGVSWGDIALVAEDIPEGSYTLRAYTNWMQNFGEDYVFKKNIYISSTTGSATLVGTNFKLTDKGDKTNIQAGLRFTGLNGQTLGLRDMQFRVMNGRRTLFRDKVATNIDGTMDINFDLADKTALKNLSIQAQYRGKGTDTTTLIIPITINRPENTDLQYLPEGGNLVAGVATKVGFKAIGEDGKSVEVAGKIYNSKQQEISAFKSTHKGMGSFEFTPELGENYIAKIDQPTGITKSYALPLIHPSGTALRITETRDSIIIAINTAAAPATYYLVGQARGVVCYAIHPDLSTGKAVVSVAKSLFPTGIARFTLLTNTNIPLNERIVYVDHHDNLNISIQPDKSSYGLRDSIALAITVKDKEGKPVEGTFSLAVTDNDQVKTDSLGSNMLNSLLFTSDLKGMVEEPDWYLENANPERLAALDNLLLTQGWVGYDWKDVFNSIGAEPKYRVEKEFIVQGKVTNVLNKPVQKTSVTIMQKHPLVTDETLTDDEGRFTFKRLLPADSAYYIILAKNKNGKAYNVGVKVDEFSPPIFAAPIQKMLPWYVNTDTTLLNNKNTKIAELKAEADYKGEGHLLKTVEIKAKKFIPGSHNLNGPGEADIIVDEKEMQAGKKKSLYEFLQYKFPNVHKLSNFGSPRYQLNGRLVSLVIDGATPPWDVEVYMDFFTAEDIKGIEIMSNPKYALAYDPGIIHELANDWDKNVPIFLEITTYSGHGVYLNNTPGRYVYKPTGFSFPHDFYRPKYTDRTRNIAMGTDLRSTIHWEPNLVTDKDGKGIVSFFSADKPADYTIIMEGTDLNGNIGYRSKTIKIAPAVLISK